MRKYLKEGQYSIDESDMLGKGSFGKVYRGYDHLDSKWVAIKSVDLESLQKYGDEMKQIICNEITVMRKFTKNMKEKPCPYLVKHEDCFRTDVNIYIVMELCQGGTLNDILNQGALKEKQVIKILEHLLLGLQYLDDLSISHRDLKPENIFISSQFNNGENETCYKIGDFGFAAQKQTFNQILGTYPFMAPEIYYRQNYTSKVDIWSVGVITYQLLFNELYFFGKNKWEIEKKVKQTPFILSADRKNKISSKMERFITLCLLKDQNQRPKASDLLKLPLFVKKQLDNSIFDAIDCELQYCQFLRSMAEETCQFGNKQGRETQFMQMYFLKKAYSIINLLTYSVMNHQNYLNLDPEIFTWFIADINNSKYQQLDGKIQKQCILITSIYNSKYEQFGKYISRFSSNQQSLINGVIGHEDIYNDVHDEVYRQELKKWIKVLQGKDTYKELKMKYQKLYDM